MKKEKLIIIDGTFIPYVCCCNKIQTDEDIAKNGKQEDRTQEQVFVEIDNYIKNIFYKINSNMVYEKQQYIGFIDTHDSFRKTIGENYKKKRKKEKPKYFHESVDYMTDKWFFNTHDFLEADDMVLIHEQFYKNLFDVIIATIDKDILNTEGKRYSAKNNIYINCDSTQENFMFWRSVITGDNTDGVGGLKGVGIKNVNFDMGECNAFYRLAVFNRYIEKLGEYNGIKEFAKNYLLLKIIKNPKEIGINDFKISEIREYLNY